MEPTEGSETSAALKLTPGKYPKEDIQHSKPDESLKSRYGSINYQYHVFCLIWSSSKVTSKSLPVATNKYILNITTLRIFILITRHKNRIFFVPYYVRPSTVCLALSHF
jgi:hypothetical protein